MKLPHTKYGLACDPRGAQVTLQYKGRTLLGDVRGSEYDATHGAILLDVRHFNGEPWLIKPGSHSVDVLERTFDKIPSDHRCSRCNARRAKQISRAAISQSKRSQP